jgi:hypothetical protein
MPIGVKLIAKSWDICMSASVKSIRKGIDIEIINGQNSFLKWKKKRMCRKGGLNKYLESMNFDFEKEYLLVLMHGEYMETRNILSPYIKNDTFYFTVIDLRSPAPGPPTGELEAFNSFRLFAVKKTLVKQVVFTSYSQVRGKKEKFNYKRLVKIIP